MNAPLVPDLATVLVLSTRMFLLVVFALAAQHKLRNFLEFTGVVQQYRLLPKALAPPGAITVLGLELLTVALLLFPATYGFATAALLLLLYSIAIGVNLSRGRRHIDCGCGGAAVPLSIALLMRNLTMLVLTLVAIALTPAAATISIQHIGGAVVFGISLLLLYAIVNQLLANAGIYRRLWLGETTA